MRTIVGRERELDAIRSFLAGGDGRSRVLRLEGVAGIGKTTLWEAAIGAASERGLRVLAARPLEVETRISFAAVGDLLAGVLDEIATELPDPQVRALEVALLLRDPDGPPPGPQAIAFAFLSALRALARATPTLVAIDDLQWLDQPTAVILTYAARRVGDERIRFLFTTRTDGSPEAAGTAVDGTAVEALRLTPLSPGALQRMFHETFGDGLSRPLLHRVHSTSGGNPFYALELGRALAQQANRLQPGQPLPVLSSLSSLVDQRLDSLPDATARALRIAALSPEPTVALLEAAMGAPFDLSPAVTANVVSVEHGRVVFSHSLLSAAIAAKLSGPERMDIHQRLGELSTDPEGRAHHLALSASVPAAGIAAELESAAGAARARGSPGASADLLEHALRLSPPGDDGVVRRTLAAADVHFETGDTDRALTLLEALTEELPPGGERAEVLCQHATVRAELELDLTAAIALYQRALAEPALGPRLAARIHGDLAWLAPFVSNLSDGLRHAKLAVAFAERTGAPLVRAVALTADAFVHTVAGEPWPAGALDEALALEDAGERFRIDRCPSLVVGVRLLWSGELEAARQRFEAVRVRAVARGDETNITLLDFHLAQIALQSGAVASAAERVREATQLAEQTGVNTAELRTLKAQIDAHHGDVEAALSAATELLRMAERADDPTNSHRALVLLGHLELSRGRALEAHEHLLRALEVCRRAEIGAPTLLRFITDAVEALLSLDRPADAEAAFACFETPARRLGHAWALALVDRCTGLIKAATGDVPAGLADLRRARDAGAQLPFPFDLARTLLALGTVERRARQRREARATLEAALELFERLKAPLWAERTRAELDRIGGRAPSRNELTPHEHRIAVLVSAGNTNREAAAALVVSVHTIEAALTRIYAKFQVRSRTELAARLAEQPGKL
jgi:DNA-binding CsgD family transcriptional regulator